MIGAGEPVPEHPYPGQQWKEVRHDKTVTWLAFWKDPISQKDFKYVWLAANSTFKSDSDLAKYEKARKLKVFTLMLDSPYYALQVLRAMLLRSSTPLTLPSSVCCLDACRQQSNRKETGVDTREYGVT